MNEFCAWRPCEKEAKSNSELGYIPRTAILNIYYVIWLPLLLSCESMFFLYNN